MVHSLFLSLFRAGHVFLHIPVFPLAVNGLKGPAASRPVQGFPFRPTGIRTIEITEIHRVRSNLLKGRVFQMKELAARIPKEHLHLVLPHKPGHDPPAKGGVAHPVTLGDA